MNPNAKDPEMTRNRISNEKDGILPLVGPGVTNAKRRRAGLPWVLAVVFSVTLYLLVSPLKCSTLLATSLQGTSSAVNDFGKETIEKPTVTTDLTGNGRTMDVLWDKYSLVLKGQRIFIQYVRP